MIAKIALVIIMAALLTPFPCPAEMVKLQRYTIDTGSYVLPLNYEIQAAEFVDGVYYEGLAWDIGKDKHSLIVIAKCDEPTDPRALQYALMAESFCNDSENLKNSSRYLPVEKPYPGWVSSCKAKGNGQQILVYAGSVDNETILVLSTSETPDTSTRILGNLRVMPSQEASDNLAASQSRSS